MKKRRTAIFFANSNGSEPVRQWLKDLSVEDRKEIGGDIFALELGANVEKPLCDGFGDGLWEVRTRLKGGRIARGFFSLKGSRVLLLHGFIKKTQKTPDREIKLARRRKKTWEKENG